MNDDASSLTTGPVVIHDIGRRPQAVRRRIVNARPMRAINDNAAQASLQKFTIVPIPTKEDSERRAFLVLPQHRWHSIARRLRREKPRLPRHSEGKTMRLHAGTTALLLSALTTGCASIVSGVNQPLAVETRLNGEALAGASCKLTSNKGTWFVTTPGSVVVHRGFQDLIVECSKTDMPTATASVTSSTKAMAFGNILFGGIIGVGVDMGTGSAYDYPDLISVEMNGPARDVAIAAPVAAPVTRTDPYVPAPAPPAVVASNASLPIAPTVAPATPSPYAAPLPPAPIKPAGRENRYQVSAETFARSQSCAATPEAILAAVGPGSETYSIACVNRETLIARCDFGHCREMR